jgi:hypothetical protein
VEDDLVAGLETELGDPGSHRARADDPDDHADIMLGGGERRAPRPA